MSTHTRRVLVLAASLAFAAQPTRYKSFPGQELFVPATAFPTFNEYMLSGRIFVTGPMPAP